VLVLTVGLPPFGVFFFFFFFEDQKFVI